MLFVPAIAKRQRSQMTPSTTSKVTLPSSNLGISSLLSNTYCHHYDNFNQQYAHQKLQDEMDKKANAHKADKTNNNNNNSSTNNTITTNSSSGKNNNNSVDKMPTKPEQIVEAMKKLDEKLVSYLSGEGGKAAIIPDLDKADNEYLNNNYQLNGNDVDNNNDDIVNSTDDLKKMMMMTPEEYREEQLKVFESVNGLSINMEALTLEAEGTRRMELLQNDIRPIFTVECQLSHELVEKVPRSEMFHIMQFESEKFQSTTQCTRFGQEAKRQIHLSLSNEEDPFDKMFPLKEKTSGSSTLPNMGRIHFIVWWREPGTCLNEMLGMGVLHLNQLYNANLLDQCKCIMIKRRDIHLANLYFKISLLAPKILQQKQQEIFNPTKSITKAINMHNTNLNNYYNNDQKNNLFYGEAFNQGCALNGNDINNKNNNNTNQAAKDHDDDDEMKNLKSSINTDWDLLSLKFYNNNLEQLKNNYMADTNNVRLLKGLLYLNDLKITQQDLLPEKDLASASFFLVCRNFWKAHPTFVMDAQQHHFDLFEEFNILNDPSFHERTERKCLNIELWLSTKSQKNHLENLLNNENTNDTNGNSDGKSILEIKVEDECLGRPLGLVQIPLHPFYVAYRDIGMTNRMSEAPLPVISTDTWLPLTSCGNGNENVFGTLKCLLAIGTEDQIKRLEEQRLLNNKTISKHVFVVSKEPLTPAKDFYGTKFLQKQFKVPETPSADQQMTKNDKNKSDILYKIAEKLQTLSTKSEAIREAGGFAGTSSQNAKAAKPNYDENLKTFKFSLNIQSAYGLPLNPSFKSKKGTSKRNTLVSKRFPPDEEPSTYVTFQADECPANVYKSHEGPVFATKIIEKSTGPVWQETFHVTVTTDYLFNAQKRFILKIWKKAATTSDQRSEKGLVEPSPANDGIIGFAALDLTVFLRGLQINGALKIVDFNGRANGEIIVRAYPLDDIYKMLQQKQQQHYQSVQQQLQMLTKASLSGKPQAYQQNLNNPSISSASSSATAGASPMSTSQPESKEGPSKTEDLLGESSGFSDEQFKMIEESLDIKHLNLAEAIKRQTFELQKIHENLKDRLSGVTGPLQENLDFKALENWQSFEDLCGTPQDSEMQEFEDDLNTIPSEAPSTSASSSSMANNKNLLEEKMEGLEFGDEPQQNLNDSTKNEFKNIE